MEKTVREKAMEVIIVILSLIIVFGGAYIVSELKYCKVEETKSYLVDVDMAKFRELLSSEDYSIIYLARPTCYYCQQEEPIVKQVSSKYEVEFNYLNTENLSDSEFKEIFALSTELFGEDGSQFGTPTILIVQNGKIVDSTIGLIQNEDLVKFIEPYGFTK